jgi:hypothetical protein
MINIYIVYSEGSKCGEIEGVFDADENILDVWSCNDAQWRNEYFAGFMDKLGIEVHYPAETIRAKLEKKLIEHCKKEWGL